MKPSSLIAGLVLLLALSPLGAGRASADYEFPVCTRSPAQQWMPAASGTRVVWGDQRHGDWDIFMYDLATGWEQAICTAAGDQMWPEIDGDRIVWMDRRSGLWSVYLYDVSTGLERKLAEATITDPDGIWYTQGPDISGDDVVWSDHRNGNLDVLLYDLSTGELQQITSDPADQGEQGPRVQGGRIVWRDCRHDAKGDIYLYDIAASEESIVQDEVDLDEAQPDIWGDVVVWRQADATSFTVAYRDLSSPAEGSVLDTGPGTKDHPRVNAYWVVWSAHERDAEDITLWEEVRVADLETLAARKLEVSSQFFGTLGPTLADSGVVAFEDFRNGTRDPQTNADIYGVLLTRFQDVMATHWAYGAVEACVSSGVVMGYEDGTYHPEYRVTRGQMAVFAARGLAGGDEYVPDFTGTPTFPDVDAAHWALDYVEYVVEQNIVGGYLDGTYQPTNEVTRDQMAVYVARAMVAPTTSVLDSYMPADPRNFPDVLSDHWAYTYVEYCVEQGVVGGYLDGTYRPTTVVTRDQMAVYIARAFGL